MSQAIATKSIAVKITSVEDAIAIANEIERTETSLKLLKEALKGYVKSNGALETSTKCWNMNKSISWKFEPEKLKEIAQFLAMEGRNPWQYLTLSSDSIKKLGWEENNLSQFGEKKVTERFSSTKN